MRRVIIGALMLAVAPAGWAQAERSGSADARVAQQLQQLSSERAALALENDRLQQELDRIKAELSKAAAGSSALERRARALEASASQGEGSAKQAQEQLERTRAQLQELVAKFRETAQTLRDVETERASLKGQLAQQERAYEVCVDRNVSLYQLNAEVLERMEKRGFWSSVAEREPFTRLKRVELENLIDDYRYRAQELRLPSIERSEAKQPGE